MRVDEEITAVMFAATGDQVRLTPDEAARARVLLLAGRMDPQSPRYVHDPVSYVASSIRRDPAKVLAEIRRPPIAERLAGHAEPLPPAYSRTVAEALAEAMPDPTRAAGGGSPAG